jgi:hypothetical protein
MGTENKVLTILAYLILLQILFFALNRAHYAKRSLKMIFVLFCSVAAMFAKIQASHCFTFS